MKFMCHFLWQAQHLVKCGMIAGPGNVVIFNRICFWRARKVTSAARRVAVCVFMVGSWSDRSRIGNDTSAVFSKFVSDFGRSFFVAGIMTFILSGRRPICNKSHPPTSPNTAPATQNESHD